ncbi:MAG: hypothetical protein M1383_00615 [Patescibacteria group bacterium]|nr:hypothetical protein [Patescibacteria group bacterium]
MNKFPLKYYIVILLAIAILAGTFALAVNRGWLKQPQNAQTENLPSNSQQNKDSGQFSSEPSSLSVNNLDNAKLPANMPANLPWEKNAEILQNYEVTNPVTGQRQSTRVYVSKKTLAENLSVYKKYLESNGWAQTAPPMDTDNLKALSADKNGGHLDIIISYNTTTKQNTVNVSFTSK